MAATLVAIFASPWALAGYTAAIAVAALLVILATQPSHCTDTDTETDAGDTHGNPPQMRTADAALIDAQCHEALRNAWHHMSPAKQPLGSGGTACECTPPCSPRACDMGNHCARLTDGNVRIFQRLSRREVAALKLAAQETALADHATNSNSSNPCPHHTRAFAIWAIEYARQRDALVAVEISSL